MTEDTLLPPGVAWRGTTTRHTARCHETGCGWTFLGTTASDTWNEAAAHVSATRHRVRMTSRTITGFAPKAALRRVA